MKQISEPRVNVVSGQTRPFYRSGAPSDSLAAPNEAEARTRYAARGAAHRRPVAGLVERFEREGQTRGGFCAAHGLAVSTFDLWRRKLRGALAVREEVSEALFVELSNPAVAETQALLWEVELELRAGVVLRVRRAMPC